MTRPELLTPLTEELPCGPDLEQTDDGEFVEYYFEAESRLPERYFIPGSPEDGREDRLFDPRSVDLRAEVQAISGLLARSRDLRLLSLQARFQILAGRLSDFVNSVEAMTDLLAEWPQAVNPTLANGTAERRSAIEALNNQTTVVAPLMHLSLLPNSDISLRRYLVASGVAAPRLSEGELAGTDVTEPLRSDANQKHVRAAQDLLTRAAGAIFKLQRQVASRDAGAFSADLAAVREVIASIQGMISSARPDVPGWSESNAQPVEMGEVTPASIPEMVESSAASPIATAPTEDRAVPNRNAAAAGLEAALGWLAENEPSSPALILVAQARALVGAPLVEAIEVLMPERAGQAILTISQSNGFALPMEKLRQLTKTGLENGQGGETLPVPVSPILQRGDLIAQILGVEGYFTMQEPASPIPLLLAKARSMLDKRFDAIMAELLIPPASAG